jgi:manganese oxidase
VNGSPSSTARTVVSPLTRTLILAYGGVAVFQLLLTIAGGSTGAESDRYLHWLRDGTLAFPAVALVVAMAFRRTSAVKAVSVGSASLYAVVMGAGSVIHGLVPADSHASHESTGFSSFSLLGQTIGVMAAAAAYWLIVNVVLALLEGSEGTFPVLDKLPSTKRLAPFVVPLAVTIAVIPALVFNSGERAAAQTSFPDQTIHPRGSLLLIARTLGDGSMAYVAPDFGVNGVRPVIEMTEGETLNITLKNELSADVSLHVHGVHYNQDSDGTRHSNSFVKPGQQKVYQWRAAVGTSGYWHYHDHVMGDDEGSGGILGGLYGGLIVRKPGDPKPAHTFVIVGNDKTLNGRIYPDTPTPTAKQGELVEWLVISHGNRVHTFHLHAHRWLTPNRTSDPNPAAPANASSGHEDNHILAPGDSFGFLVIAGEDVGPGMWMYHCHFQDHASAMKGFFKVLPAGGGEQPAPQTSRTFSETGKTVSGRFLDYWQNHGDLAQQGFPISDVIQEKSDLDGKTYQVQYFERAVFELHPENAPPYDVLLSQLGTFRYKQKYPGR